MAGISQSARDAIKANLDRRYAQRTDVLAEVDLLRSELALLRSELALLHTQLADVHSHVESLEADQHKADGHADQLRTDLESLRSTVDDVQAATRAPTAFLSQEDPHDLRKRLFEAHRLAREGAIAIEQLLQSDVLLRRDIAASIDP